MISTVYQLTAPRILETTYNQLDISNGQVLIRPAYLSICKADQRYYQGTRSQSVLKQKLPMALIHECMAFVEYDPKGVFSPGDKVIAIPNMPTEDDDIIAENYRKTSHFRSSGYDGFLQDYVLLPHDRLVKISNDVNPYVASFTELISVCRHMISRFDKNAHKRRNIIGVWGDGNLGFITSVLLKYIYPESKIYVFGVNPDKLSYFTFADETFNVDHVPNGIYVNHAFECVGGTGSQSAVNQIIDLIEPEGTVSLGGVSENFVNINTRMILEKGLIFFGSSRSGRVDFEATVDFLEHNKGGAKYFENLIGDIVNIREIDDIHHAFNTDVTRRIGKTILIWNK